MVLATGVRNCYFGHDRWFHVAPGLKTLEEAAQIRQKVLSAFEAAERETDPARQTEFLTFVVIGAGPTGVELAGALGEISRLTLKGDFRNIRPEDARILLLEAAPRVLPHFHPALSRRAEYSLLRLGVRSMLNVRVSDISESGVTAIGDHGEFRIPTRTVIWAAGVTASPFCDVLARRANAKLEDNGQVIVEPDCSLEEHPEIFVIGDLASFSHDGRHLPGVAQVAIQQVRYVARVIRKRLRGETEPEPFHYFDKGQMAVIGRGRAVAQAGPLRVSGFFAWLAWLFIHLIYIAEFSNRLFVLIRWCYLYVSFRRGSRLITGSDLLIAEKIKLHEPEPDPDSEEIGLPD